jgi:serine/threonine-protein kinase RsbW
MPHRRRPPAPATASALARAAEALDAFCAAERLPADLAWRLRVAVDEVLANIVSHGARGGRAPTIEVAFRRSGDDVELVVSDDGPAFDPLAQPAPDVTLPLEAREPGGLGIALVKALMDNVQYERTTRNVLTMRKQIASAQDSWAAPPDPVEGS